TILAVGGEIKSSICLAVNSHAILSQHIGDMGHAESLEMIQRVSSHLIELYNATPTVIASDQHPGYLSVQWAERQAREQSLQHLRIQHHHAHAAALMAEHQLPAGSSIIACVWDGTGLGSDGAIWGGEWLIADRQEFTRFAHLSYVPLPGGDACILKPARSALAHLFRYSLAWDQRLPCVSTLTETERRWLRQQLERDLNCIPTSSMGRLFDAVAALIGTRQQIDYEGQAAIELEYQSSKAMQTTDALFEPYAYSWQSSKNQSENRPDPIKGAEWQLCFDGMFSCIVEDTLAGKSAGDIGARFHLTLAHAALDVCIIARKVTGINQVGLTGGVFQNVLLTRLLRQQLESHDFQVLTHRLVPPNDAGIALGQATIARDLLST
ncbi:MAG: carbamoyltransferase HypF, partial [Pirellulaceae bacterium]|nr:carbamoyltransferase HypF [Pirellulaceae bacterium]